MDYVKDDEEAVKMVQAEMGAAPTLSESMQGNTNAVKNSHDNVRAVLAEQDYGNSSTYLLRRLKRDAPAVAEAYLAGEHKSVRAAAKAAGIVKDPSPYERCIKLLPRLTMEEYASITGVVVDEEKSAADSALSKKGRGQKGGARPGG